MNIIEGFNSMMSVLEDAVGAFNGHLWSFLPIPLLLAGIYFGIRTFIVQIRKIPDMFRAVVEKPAEQNDEDISAFKAFTISAASRVGTGNVAGTHAGRRGNGERFERRDILVVLLRRFFNDSPKHVRNLADLDDKGSNSKVDPREKQRNGQE
mgnify:CR=1 FL=1